MSRREPDKSRGEERRNQLAARAGAPAIATGRHPTAALVGPCYDAPGLSRWLGLTKQEIDELTDAGEVLACPVESGACCYPALQFDEHGNTLPHLRELLQVLVGRGVDRRWRAARWLAAPAPYLPDGVSAAQWLRAGGDPDPVLAAARADARRWAG